MKKHFFYIIAALFLLTFSFNNVTAQTFYDEILGFRLEQYRGATNKHFGSPDKTGMMGENIEYEAFALNDDGSLYVIFQYFTSARNLIYSIQVTSYAGSFDPGFRGLKFGMSEKQIEETIGKPNKKVDVGQHGHRWEYNNTNFSIEVNKNRLSSIRLVNDPEFDSQPEQKITLTFKHLEELFTKGTNSQLGNFIMPNLVLYLDGKPGYFTLPLKEEIESDSSKVFSTLRQLFKEVIAAYEKESEKPEGQFLMRTNQPILLSFKFFNETKLQQMIFKWDKGRWRLWEVDAGKPEPSRPNVPEYKPGTLKHIATEVSDGLLKNPQVLMTKNEGQPILSISKGSHLTKALVINTDESRPIPDSRKFMILTWLQVQGMNPAIAERFETEYKFTEDGKVYWLPLPKAIEKDFLGKVKKGDSVHLMVAWFGLVFDEKENHESLFIINDFVPIDK